MPLPPAGRRTGLVPRLWGVQEGVRDSNGDRKLSQSRYIADAGHGASAAENRELARVAEGVAPRWRVDGDNRDVSFKNDARPGPAAGAARRSRARAYGPRGW